MPEFASYTELQRRVANVNIELDLIKAVSEKEQQLLKEHSYLEGMQCSYSYSAGASHSFYTLNFYGPGKKFTFDYRINRNTDWPEDVPLPVNEKIMINKSEKENA